MSYRYGLLSTQRAVRWLTVLSVIIGQVAVMTKGADAYRETGFLFGPSPSAAEVYDHATGRALLIPGLPIDPPRPRDDAVRMAIIDSGVISTHPQLRTLVIAEKAFAGGDPVDRIGHGTLVALQSIRQHADPEMQRILGDRFSYPALLSARVTDDVGLPTVKAVIAAIHWVAAEGARVVNLSLGFRGEAAEFEDLCRTVRQYPKVFFAAASGNFGPNVKVYPAACAGENIMAVGEVRDGMPTPHSGAGEIYASSDQSFVWPWQYHLDLGRTAAQAGKYQEAREQFKRSLGDERNVQALFQLALLDIHAGNPSQAYKRLQEAVKLECNLPILHTHLGAVRYLQGQYKEAEAHLRDALAIDGNDQMANFNLGQTLFQMGRADEALATYQRVREVNPNYPRLDIAIAEAQSRVGKGKGE